ELLDDCVRRVHCDSKRALRGRPGSGRPLQYDSLGGCCRRLGLGGLLARVARGGKELDVADDFPIAALGALLGLPVVVLKTPIGGDEPALAEYSRGGLTASSEGRHVDVADLLVFATSQALDCDRDL